MNALAHIEQLRDKADAITAIQTHNTPDAHKQYRKQVAKRSEAIDECHREAREAIKQILDVSRLSKRSTLYALLLECEILEPEERALLKTLKAMNFDNKGGDEFYTDADTLCDEAAAIFRQAEDAQ